MRIVSDGAVCASVNDACRISPTRAAQEKALPFDPLIPNEQTIAAMREAREGGLDSFDSIGKLIDDLNAAAYF